jgi:stearoyl-CoA desaturase (delta-9 desaturase)
MMLTPFKLLLIQGIAHLATILWLFSGPSFYDFIIVFSVYFVMGCLGMSVGYHRLLTHRSFKTSKIVEILLTIFATIGMTGSSISWTAAHRKHHASTDKRGDPHSPLVLGYFRAQFLSMFSEIDIKRSPLIRDRFHKYIHRHYILLNISYSFLLFLFLDLNGMIIFHLAPAVILWNAGSLINTVCHTKWLGYVNHKVNDNSVNNPLLGIFMWGEGWHNNHHRYQNRPRIGEKWWELDIGWLIIILIRKY